MCQSIRLYACMSAVVYKRKRAVPGRLVSEGMGAFSLESRPVTSLRRHLKCQSFKTFESLDPRFERVYTLQAMHVLSSVCMRNKYGYILSLSDVMCGTYLRGRRVPGGAAGWAAHSSWLHDNKSFKQKVRMYIINKKHKICGQPNLYKTGPAEVCRHGEGTTCITYD